MGDGNNSADEDMKEQPPKLPEVTDEEFARMVEVNSGHILIFYDFNIFFYQERAKQKRDKIAELRQKASAYQKEASAIEKEVDKYEEATGKSIDVGDNGPARKPPKPTARSQKWRGRARESCKPYVPPKNRGPRRGGPGGKSGTIQIGTGRPIVYVTNKN